MKATDMLFKMADATGSPSAPNTTLSDLALSAAIELERVKAGREGNLTVLRNLGAALSERGLSDLTLVPVYDRALAMGGAGTSSRNDLFSRLQAIMAKLESASNEDLDGLRDFCLALHDALLTKKLQSARPPVLSQRRVL
jgi:hypothetical protein